MLGLAWAVILAWTRAGRRQPLLLDGLKEQERMGADGIPRASEHGICVCVWRWRRPCLIPCRHTWASPGKQLYDMEYLATLAALGQKGKDWRARKDRERDKRKARLRLDWIASRAPNKARNFCRANG